MTRFERAAQIWAVLAWAARHRQTITYGDLARAIGVSPAGMGQLLEPIQSYCLTHSLPPLTILVVQTESGMPGAGFTGAAAVELGRAMANVFACDWLKRRNPGAAKLETATLERPSNGIRTEASERADHVGNSWLDKLHIPAADATRRDLEAFALSFDGYEYAGSREAAERLRERWREATFDELRAALFYEQRRLRWLEQGPNDESDATMRAMVARLHELAGGR